MAKATKMNVNYRESILDRAYRLELIKKDEYAKHQEKLSLLNEKLSDGEPAQFDAKEETFLEKNFAKSYFIKVIHTNKSVHIERSISSVKLLMLLF